MSKASIEEILAPKTEARPRIYAYSIADTAHKGLLKELKNKAKDKDLSAKEKKKLSDEEKEYKSKRKQVQEKLIKFATRIPAFMYLTDFRENKLPDVITKLEPDLFLAVTGLTVKDFHLLVSLKVFNTEQMNQAVFAFRRYEDASLPDSEEGGAKETARQEVAIIDIHQCSGASHGYRTCF